jgi:hypothetical protein
MDRMPSNKKNRKAGEVVADVRELARDLLMEGHGNLVGLLPQSRERCRTGPNNLCGTDDLHHYFCFGTFSRVYKGSFKTVALAFFRNAKGTKCSEGNKRGRGHL